MSSRAQSKRKKIIDSGGITLNRIIAIDQGNRNTKTTWTAFPSGYVECGHLPAFGNDVLAYKGKEYTISERRINQENDKAKNEDIFIVTLFGIGKELLENPGEDGVPDADEVVRVTLLIGLPPSHYKGLYKKYEQYFLGRGPIEFEFKGTPLCIEIEECRAYPQAYAAVLTVMSQIKNDHIVNIVDIGGYTLDFMRLVNLQVDMESVDSKYFGMNHLFQKINTQVRATGAQEVEEFIIEGILLGDAKVKNDSRADVVRQNAKQFVPDMLAEVAQAKLNIAEHKTVFVGGGSILLREEIIASGKVPRAVIVEDPFANAKGYKLLYDKEAQGK